MTPTLHFRHVAPLLGNFYCPRRVRARSTGWLAAAAQVASTGYGALMPLRPNWLAPAKLATFIRVVSALVAEHATHPWQRARRFAWLGSVSLIGFLFGPWLIAAEAWISHGALREVSAPLVVVLLSTLQGAVTITGTDLDCASPSAQTPSSPRPDRGSYDRAVCGDTGVGACSPNLVGVQAIPTATTSATCLITCMTP